MNKSVGLLATIICFFVFVSQGSAQLTSGGKSSALVALRYEVRPNITYLKTKEQDLKLDLYLPYESKMRMPTLIWFHGGGWTRSSKEEEMLYILPYLDAGWTVVNVEYRLAGKSLAPAAAEDCLCALRWIAANAADHKIDIETTVLSGISAGGHLALASALLPTNRALDERCPESKTKLKIAAVVNWFGPSDIDDLIAGPNSFEQAITWLGDRPERQAIARALSPIHFVKNAAPPIITIHGDRDEIIPYQQSVRLHAALAKAGVANRLVTVRGGKHGDFNEKQILNAYAAIREFLVLIKVN